MNFQATIKSAIVSVIGFATQLYVTEDNLDSVTKQPEQAVKLLLQWLSDNQMKANEHKCHVLISTKEKVCVNIRTTQITNSKCEKLLGI